ncbi:glycosyltransferase [Providencia stuartii]
MKILFITGQLDIGGIECWLRDLTSLMLEKRTDLDIYILVDKPHKGTLEDELIDKGIKILRVNSSKNNKLIYMKDLYSILKRYKFDVIHSNVSYTNGIISLIGFLLKIPVRISHIHSNRNSKHFSPIKRMSSILLKICIEFFPTHKIAVSEQSKSNYLFEKNVTVMACGINLKGKESHIDIRKEKGWLENDIILCSVGRLERVKNHEFTINLLSNLPSYYKLVLAGEGSLRTELENLVLKENLQDRVIFLGGINSVISFLENNVDILLFPSFHEGFGVVAIESQLAGVPIIASTNVPTSTKISNIINYVDLDDMNSWLDNIINIKKIKGKLEINVDIFNIEYNYNKLMNIYLNKL